MADAYGLFWNAVSGDRLYDADSFAEWLRKFFTTGVFADELFVSAQGGMVVEVATGYANISGKVRFFDTATNFTMSAANSTYPRIDTVVIESNITDRTITLKTVTGLYSGYTPAATAPVRTSSIYQIVLAQILVGAGVTEITQANITDTRQNTDICGYVTGTVEEMDYSQFSAQFNSYYEQFKTTNKSDFDTWFQSMKDQLSTDAAGHLQTEIDTLSANISAIDTDLTNKNTVTRFAIAVATWSAATTTVEGTAYYTYVLSLTSVNTDVPDIMIGAASTLPTTAEQDAFNCIKYATVDKTAKTLTLYAESLPTVLFYIKVRGVA